MTRNWCAVIDVVHITRWSILHGSPLYSARMASSSKMGHVTLAKPFWGLFVILRL